MSDRPRTPPGPARRHGFERERSIRFSHCDPAGIVFFPQYLVMFNDLVESWVSESLGIAYAELIGTRRIGLPTVSLQVEFSAPSRMGEVVTLGLDMEHVGGASLRLALGCRHGDAQRVRMTQVLVTTSLETHRAIPIPDDLRQALSR